MRPPPQKQGRPEQMAAPGVVPRSEVRAVWWTTISSVWRIYLPLAGRSAGAGKFTQPA